VIVIVVLCGLVTVGCTVAGEKPHVSCADPLQANDTVPAKPAVAFTVAVSEPLAPCPMVNVDLPSEPL
jgi:hypothetical protein